MSLDISTPATITRRQDREWEMVLWAPLEVLRVNLVPRATGTGHRAAVPDNNGG